jgi:superfamily II DNA or RNA helicase
VTADYLFRRPGVEYPSALLQERDDWGLRTVDLVTPPRRFWSGTDAPEAVVQQGIEIRQAGRIPCPAELLLNLPEGDNWQAASRRSLARLHAHFLVCEDPQRRMDAREVETLAHQVSLVRHILQSDNLRRVLVADEVGLGKTVEVGLILRELLEQKPGSRILYLAPARLASNVRREFDRLNLPFRCWTALEADARLTDPKIIASLHRAVHGSNFDKVVGTGTWDVLVVDECHHLSAWSEGGTDASEAYALVKALIEGQKSDARVILMSGTPHQGHATRFENLLLFLQAAGESKEKLAGRVIYRTKDDIYDWDGNPVFPNRQVNEPLMVDLGDQHRAWMQHIHDFYRPPKQSETFGESRRRAAGWRCAQAMQWAASSPHAGLGYLVRQAIRADWKLGDKALAAALGILRPYRMGPEDEAIPLLYDRINNEIGRQNRDADIADIEDYIPGDPRDSDSQQGLSQLLAEGIELVRDAGDEKWIIIKRELLDPAGDEKVVLFAQPIETVSALARFLERETGVRAALVIGGQSDVERKTQLDSFQRINGPRYLVSSRAGGEGINLQVARRLIHIDVPWNPMDMEQRVGRIHRFGSRETIIVDTVVVKDSREADAFRIAREKLKLITSTLVEPERFESVFSRVMCLLSQDEFQGILMNEPAAPFSQGDQQTLADMVQNGFRAWKVFHDRFGEQQKSIQRQNPGLLTWEDVTFFLEQQAGAKRQSGYVRQRFKREGNAVRRVEDEATVLALSDGKPYVCGDYAETLVYGPDGNTIPKLGLNLEPVAQALRNCAFPIQLAGAAYLRWAVGEPLPSCVSVLPFGALIFMRQSVRMDKKGGWEEVEQILCCYSITKSGEVLPIEGAEGGVLLRGLFRAVIRRSPEDTDGLVEMMPSQELRLADLLRKPTEEELHAGIRHAVTPLFAAIVTS